MALGIEVLEVEAIYRRLAHDHALTLLPGSLYVWMAHPFSAVPTAFRVTAGDRTWWGNCIWDGLGILAALESDGLVHTRCADCGEPMTLEVSGGSLLPAPGVIHFAVPAARWWESIGHT